MGSQSYEGRVPPAKGTGPRNLPKTASPKASGARVRPSAARTPSVSPARASSGKGPPPGGPGRGIGRATSPMAKAPTKKINRPKTGRPANTRRLSKPRADGPSKI